MSTTPFAVGDRVITIDADAQRGLTPIVAPIEGGLIATVREVAERPDEQGVTVVRVTWDRDPDGDPPQYPDHFGWDSRRFAPLVNEPTPRSEPEQFLPRYCYVYLRNDTRYAKPNDKVKALGLGDSGWIITRGNDVLHTGTSMLPSAQWSRYEVLNHSGFTDFVARLAKSNMRLTERDRAHEQWKHAFVIDAHDMANIEGWERFDELMTQHGLPARSRDWTVTMKVQFETTVVVTAPSEDDAVNAAVDAHGKAKPWEVAIGTGAIAYPNVTEVEAVAAEVQA